MSIAEAWQITDQYLIMNLNRSCCSSTLARCFTMFHPSSATPHTCNFFMNSETRKKSRTTKHPDHTNGKITILTIPPGNSCTKPIMHLSRSFHLVCRLDLELWLHRSISIGCHRCHQCHLGQGIRPSSTSLSLGSVPAILVTLVVEHEWSEVCFKASKGPSTRSTKHALFV